MVSQSSDYDAPDCTCAAGNGMGFPAQHATLCPRFAHPRVIPPTETGGGA